jgi:hypothetical protein
MVDAGPAVGDPGNHAFPKANAEQLAAKITVE